MRNNTSISLRFGFASFAILMLLLGNRPASAQVSGGLAGISGIVHDSTGAVVSGADVVVSNPLKGVHITLTTTEGGVFNAPSLLPATGYDVTVNKQGFSPYEVKDIELSVGQDLNLEVRLTLASATERIEVVGTAPLIDTTKSDVSQVIDSQQILDLPINGRRVDSFVLLTPGVANDGVYGLLTFRGVANGNTFLLDGNDSTEQFYVENNGRTRITSQISADAVQEFQVVSSNYSAEYGRAMGGVVNTVTRSGTNDLHGTLYTFYRNQDMMARDAYTPVSFGNPDQWRLQSGASFGGPIIKDKLFFFINGDFTRNDFPLADVYNSPLINAPTATTPPSFIGCGTGATPATPAQCAAINALLPAYFGLIPRNVVQDLAFGRIDYHFSDRNVFSVSFNFMHFNSPNGLQQTVATSTTGAGINGNANDYGRVRNGKATWTSILRPNLVNTFRYGYNTDLEGDTLNNSVNNPLGLLNACVGSSGSCSSGVLLGAVYYVPRVEPNETRNEWADDISWTKGKHVVKFGVDFITTNDYSYYISGANGQYNYANANAFALDFSGNTTGAKNWRSYTQSFGDPALNTRINDYDFYIEDQWRASDRLTATFGMRYEYEQLPSPPVCNQAYAATCQPVNTSPKDLMPRMGLAYRLDDKTVLRAGYGVYYSRIAGAFLQDLYTTGNGITVSSISLSAFNSTQLNAGPLYPKILSAAPTGLASTTTLQITAPNFSTPYAEQGSLSVERQLAHDLGLTVSYLWSRGVHLLSTVDLDMPTATAMHTFTIDDSSGNQVGTFTTPVTLSTVVGVGNGRPNPNFGAIYEDGNGVTSFYNGLAVQLHKQFSHGLMGDLSYTWSHEIDDGQGYGQDSYTFYGSSLNQYTYNGNFQFDRGNGLLDLRHRLSLSFVWQPTITHRSGAFFTYVVNNWQLSSIFTADSSRPTQFNSPKVFTNDSFGFPSGVVFNDFSLNGQGLNERVPFWPVNTVLAPPLIRDDLRISKIIPINERFKATINLEIFNIANNWSPTVVAVGNAYQEHNSVLTPATTPVDGEFPNCACSDGYPIDGTEARRLQISGRLTF